jgi:hypothetical protein
LQISYSSREVSVNVWLEILLVSIWFQRLLLERSRG